MSKSLDETDQYTEDLAVSSDLPADSRLAGETGLRWDSDGTSWEDHEDIDDDESELEPLFQLRLKMARARAAKSSILRGQLERLDAAYVAARASQDRQLLNSDDREVIIFTAKEIIRSHNPSALEYGAMAEAKLLLREILFKHFLLEQERIIINSQIFCVNEGHEKISWGELLDYLLESNWPILIDELSALQKDLPASLFTQWQALPNSARLRALCLSYPLPATPILDIYNRFQLETFYSHLLASISGLYRDRYEQFNCQRGPMQRELNELEGVGGPLPSIGELGPLAEQLRVHLLQQLMQCWLNRTPTGPGCYDPLRLLEHYQYFGKKAESQAKLAEFEALPVNHILSENIDRLLGRNTRQKIIAVLGEVIPSPWLIETMAELFALIEGIERAGQHGIPEAPKLADQFGREVRLMLVRASAIKKPADQSIIEGLFQGMKDQVRLAKYCYKRLSRPVAG